MQCLHCRFLVNKNLFKYLMIKITVLFVGLIGGGRLFSVGGFVLSRHSEWGRAASCDREESQESVAAFDNIECGEVWL